MKKTILSILFYCFLFSAFSQTVTVKDSLTADVVPFATLIAFKPSGYIETNANGQADISKFKGTEKIEIQASGYELKSLTYSEIKAHGFIITLKANALNLSEVVVSGNRQAQNSSEVPSKIISISAKNMFLQNPQTAADLLSISGKVFIQKSQQGGGSPMIRGFATNRLLYSVDGVRMNTAIFRGGNIQNVISLDPFAIERTEVLFGASSVMYGSDAIGGVMSFSTLTPKFSTEKKPVFFGKVLSRYATANKEKTAHLDVGAGFKKWAFISSISSFNFNDLTMGKHGNDAYLRPVYVERINNTDSVIANKNPLVQTPTAYSQINFMQKVSFAPTATIDLSLGFHYSKTSDYARYDRHIYLRKGLPRYGRWDYGPQKWMMTNGTISDKKKNSLYDLMTVRLAFQQFEESRISRNFKSDLENTNTERVNAYSANVDFLKNFDSLNAVFYGIEWVSNFIFSEGIEKNIISSQTAQSASRYPKSDWSSYAVYATYKHKFSELLLLQTGLRYNYFAINALFDTTFFPFPFTTATINNSALTGSFGLVFQLNKNLIATTNFATAFRAPNIDDMGKVFDSEPGSVVVPNPNLKAEYAYNFDLGISGTVGNLLKFDVSVYRTWLQNALVRRNFTLNGLEEIMYRGELSTVQAIQNAAVANVYGIQTGFEVKLPIGLSFGTDLTYTKGEEETDDGTFSPSRHAAPFFLVSKLSYNTKKINLQLFANYSGAKTFNQMPAEEIAKPYLYIPDANGNPYSPDWYTLNFNAMYNFSSHISLSAGIENLTDRRYRPYSSGLTAPGRNFVFSAKVGF